MLKYTSTKVLLPKPAIDASVEHVEAVSPGVCITPANKTPSRSQRLATRNGSRIDTPVSSPVRYALRSHVAKKAMAAFSFFSVAFMSKCATA